MYLTEGDDLTNKVAFGGILTALSIIFLYLASYAPYLKITMFFLSGLLVAVSLIEKGIRTAWLVYVASSLLSLLVIGNMTAFMPYICFFGLYPLVKYYIEKKNENILQLVLKVLFCNLSLFALYFIWVKLLSIKVAFSIPLIYILIIIQPIFLLYDYVFTKVIFYYIDKIMVIRRNI